MLKHHVIFRALTLEEKRNRFSTTISWLLFKLARRLLVVMIHLVFRKASCHIFNVCSQITTSERRFIWRFLGWFFFCNLIFGTKWLSSTWQRANFISNYFLLDCNISFYAHCHLTLKLDSNLNSFYIQLFNQISTNCTLVSFWLVFIWNACLMTWKRPLKNNNPEMLTDVDHKIASSSHLITNY